MSIYTLIGPIDPVGKLLFLEKISVLVTGTSPFQPSCSLGRGYNSVNIVMISSFLDAYNRSGHSGASQD